MIMKQALELAAQAWQSNKTRDKVMDVDLAQAFAEILIMHQDSSIKPGDKVRINKPGSCVDGQEGIFCTWNFENNSYKVLLSDSTWVLVDHNNLIKV